MTTKKALSVITEQLENDIDYRRAWVANIAMSYIDNEQWYKTKAKKRTLNKKDKHTVANMAAEHFINQLCK